MLIRLRAWMIFARQAEKRIRLRIDLHAQAEQSTISSKLLRPAEIVGSGS